MGAQISHREFLFQQSFRIRIYIIIGGIFLIAFIFIIRLSHLQLVKGKENLLLSEKFVNKREFTEAPRGFIYGRNYKDFKYPLVENIKLIDFALIPRNFNSREDAIDYMKALCLWLNYDNQDYISLFSLRNWKLALRRNRNIVLFKSLKRITLERLINFQYIYTYGKFVIRSLRHYNLGPAAAHITGYLGAPTQRDLSKNLVQIYQRIGKSGLESFYDPYLRGKDGIIIKHRVIKKEAEVIASSQGNDIITTIDEELQQLAYDLLEQTGKRGTTILFKAATGEILAMASYPSYDPNILSNYSGSIRIRNEQIQKIQDYRSFLNLALQSKFPPASTFKPLVALSALETSYAQTEDNPSEFSINTNTEYTCRGYFVLKSTHDGLASTTFDCSSIHSRIRMKNALVYSCNNYFYQLGYGMGIDRISNFLYKLKYNELTQIDLPGEIPSFLPTKLWKEKRFFTKWYDGDTVNLSVGQGFLETTPLALGTLYAAISNCGRAYKPHLLDRIIDSETQTTLKVNKTELLYDHQFNPKNCIFIQNALREVVTRGTARSIKNFKVAIAGKTGTVQLTERKKERTHAWFVGYAPYNALPEKRLISVTFLEKGGMGSGEAAYIVGRMLEAAHQKKNFLFKETQAIKSK